MLHSVEEQRSAELGRSVELPYSGEVGEGNRTTEPDDVVAKAILDRAWVTKQLEVLEPEQLGKDVSGWSREACLGAPSFT